MTEDSQPVYVGRSKKKEIKKQAAEHEITMRDVAERLISRGLEMGLDEEPLPEEFHARLDSIEAEVEDEMDEQEIQELRAQVDQVESVIGDTDFQECDDVNSLYTAVEDVRVMLDTVDVIQPAE